MAKTKSSFLPVCLATGVLVPLLCIAVCIAACIVPFEKAQTYLNILFMDNMKIIPSTGLEGLVIVDNADIPTGEDNTRTLSDAGEIVRPSFGEQYAVLTCEAVSMRVPVYWGTGDQLFEKGACQSSSSAVLGETGNAVIDAHVNTFFSSLSEIEPGDEIVLYTSYGIFTYKASELVTFENTDKTYILPTDEDRLTLYTCKAQVLGTSTERIGVLCECVSKQFYTGGGE